MEQTSSRRARKSYIYQVDAAALSFKENTLKIGRALLRALSFYKVHLFLQVGPFSKKSVCT